jgi:F-type H+-transporting ATPase subunit b
MFLASSLLSTSSSLAALAPKGGVVVDVDATALWPVVIFVVLILALKPMLFDPMLKLFEERERRIDGAKLLARKIDQKSASALTEYEEAMTKGRTAANAEREKIRAEGLKKEAEILARVRAETAKTMEEGRAKLREEITKARAGLDAEMPAIAMEFASRALGREVRG